jgi:hypothetical protein
MLRNKTRKGELMAEQSLIPLGDIENSDSKLIAKGVNDLIIQNGNFHDHCEKIHTKVDNRLQAQDDKIASILAKVYWILGVLAVACSGAGAVIKWG